MTNEELERWLGRKVVDPEGQKIGSLADIYIDDATGEPEWLAIVTGLFGSRISFVPLTGATELGDDVLVTYPKAVVKDGPNIDADGQLSEGEEEQLYRHFGLSYAPTARAEDAIVEGATGVDTLELQDSGSTTIKAEVTPQVAQMRMRRRDRKNVEAIGLEADDEDI